MSYVRVNISDRNRTISNDLHGSISDALIAALTAEPETIEEFEVALARYVKSESDWPPLKHFSKHENFEPYDAGILLIDLAARVAAVDSTYSLPSAKGSVRVSSEFSDFAEDDGYVYVPYQLPDDWILVGSVPEYEGTSRRRGEERSKNPQFDTRQILYGKPLIKFIVEEIAISDKAGGEELFPDIHAKWLMTAKDFLRGKTPREILLEKQDFISFDLHSRSLQWSFTKVSPPALSTDSHAYRYAGFGTNETVVYYDLIRFLLGECHERRIASGDFSIEDEIRRLSDLKEQWLGTPNSEFSGRIPGRIIEMERRRINMTMSAQECLLDDDCPICVSMSEDFDTPMFWFLDGCNMDERFEFSFFKTRAEWDKEQRRFEEYNREFEEKWAKRSESGEPFQFDEDPF